MKTSIRAIVIIAPMLISINLSAQEYQWAHSFGDTDWDEGLWIDHDAQGNIYATGYFLGTLDFDPSGSVANLTSNGEGDVFIASYDPDGAYRWAISFGGSDYDLAMSIAVDQNNNRLYVTGYFLGTADFDPSNNTANLTSNGQADAFIACFSTDGNFQWANSMGSSEWDSGSRVKVDPNGNPIATGNFRGTVDFDPSGNTHNLVDVGYGDTWIAKYDTNGNLVWAINPGSNMFDSGNGITIDNNGNVYVIGQFQGTMDADPSANTANLTSNGIFDVSLLSYDNNGNYRWAHNLGGTMNDQGWSATHQNIDASEYIYITGSFEGSADFDPSANDNTLTSFGGTDIFVGCFDDNGNHMGAYNYGGPYNDAGYSIDANQDGDLVWVTGAYGGNGNLKLSKELYSTHTHVKKQILVGAEQSFMIGLFSFRYNGDDGYFKESYSTAYGNDPLSISALFPTEWGIGNGITAHNSVYLIGEYTGNIDLDASDNEAIFYSNGSSADFFIARYSQNSLAVDNSTNIPESFKLEQNYPNPFNPITTIQYNVPHDSHVTIEIFDLQGRHVTTILNSFRRVGNYSISWDGRDSQNNLVGSGTYIYRLRSNGSEIAKKMILMR